VWYKNIHSASFSFVTINARDGRMDGQTELRQEYRALHYMQLHGKKNKTNAVKNAHVNIKVFSSAVRHRWLENYSSCPFFSTGDLEPKTGKTGLVFGMQSGFIRRSV